MSAAAPAAAPRQDAPRSDAPRMRAARRSAGHGGSVRARAAAGGGCGECAGAGDQHISPSSSRLASDKRDMQIKLALERDVRLVRCEDGKLEIALESGAAKTLVNDLSRKLQLWTGRSWMVVISRDAGRADAEIDGRRAAGRAGGRRARRSAGQGGAGTIARRGDCRRAQRQGRAAGTAAAADDGCRRPTMMGFGDNWVRDDVSMIPKSGNRFSDKIMLKH